ncbi:chemotaxis protein CheC [Christensenellaceae bacterium OttesenSCG-928-L17]|nr:chemotaxis protein CheC [Christensenellaceae bacterium OttesenSCG-928-L17]
MNNHPCPVGSTPVLQPLDAHMTRLEQDALGEIGNICMGTAATALGALLAREVEITTPHLSLHSWQTLVEPEAFPMVMIDVAYTHGVNGKNLMLLKQEDAAAITGLLLGDAAGGCTRDEARELELSAMQEVMNQMVGASATSLAFMLQRAINISIPQSAYVQSAKEMRQTFFRDGEAMLKIAFELKISGLLASEMVQVFPLQFAHALAAELMAQETPPYATQDEYTEALTLHLHGTSGVKPAAALRIDTRAAKNVQIYSDGAPLATGELVYENGTFSVRVAEQTTPHAQQPR